MSPYQGFAISNFRTGFDEALEPWLIPRDAYQIVKNAHLYRGVLEKIPGYQVYAYMSYTETIQLSGAINGVNKVFTGTLNHRPSTNQFLVAASIDAIDTTQEQLTYTGSSGTTINLASISGGTGTIDINTLAVSVTFFAAPAAVPAGPNVYNSVRLTYSYLSTAASPDIMGIKPYYGSDGSRKILVFDSRRAGYVVNLAGIISIDQACDYGVVEIPHMVQVNSAVVTGAPVTYTGTTAAPVAPNSVLFYLYVGGVLTSTITDNGIGALTGTGALTATGYINYYSGAWTITFSGAPGAGNINTQVAVYGDTFSGNFTNFFSVTNYTYRAFITNGLDKIRYYDGSFLYFLPTNFTAGSTYVYDITTCVHVVAYRDRLCLLLPTVQGTFIQNGIYWSVAGSPLDFTNEDFLLAPTSESIRTFAIINSDMIVRFASSERIFRYTGDAFAPFRWDSTNNIWRCDARYSAINYDSYMTSVGRAAIVSSDGVNVQRADEIIPDFTLNSRNVDDSPIISIQQASIGQCYGERFDDFKEGWLCFKAYDEQSDTLSRSDNILAFNYLDSTYAIYEFPLNCLGFGSITDVDTWGEAVTTWGSSFFSWASFFDSFDALVDLAGDRNGTVYMLGNGTNYYDVDGVPHPVRFDVISKNFNPFIEDGQLCRLGYVDLFVSAGNQTKLRVQFYRDDTLYTDPSGEPAGYYQETTLTFTNTDSMSTTAQTKVWKRIYVGAVAREHTIRFYQNAADFTADTANQPIRIHAMVLYMKPAGRIFN